MRHATLVAVCMVVVACKHAEPPPSPGTLVELFPHGATTSSPLIVAFHGMGGAPERLAHLFDDFPAAAHIVLPRGPVPEGNGWAWFAWPPGTTEQGLARAIAAADAKLWPMVETIAHGRPIVVTGFSQGGVMAYAFAALHPTRVVLAVPISGRLPKPLWPHAPAAPVYALHGIDDEVVSIEFARDTVAAFRAAGGPTELHEYPGVPHEWRPMQADIVEHLRAAVTH